MYSLSDGSIYQVFYLSTRKSWCHLSQCFGLNLITARDFVEVKIKNVLTAVYVGVRNVDFLVKTSWPRCCRVKRLLVVGCADYHYVFILLEAVHLS